jgi:predicted RecB family nuclease
MQRHNGQLHLSATDLSNHVGCRHLTHLNVRAANGEIKPPVFNDVRRDTLRERGLAHESAYIDHLQSTLGVTADVVDFESPDAVAQTRALMQRGVHLIVQGALESESKEWQGRADVLLKVGKPSQLGDWSYEVIDTKLSRETKGGTILQLCLYAELVEAIQGLLPERVGVVTPLSMDPEWYRTLDYLAYVRRVKNSLVKSVANSVANPAETYPEPVEHCDVCRWKPDCRERRVRDDHLSLVAGITRGQRNELLGREVATVEQLASLPVPLQFRPDRGAAESYVRVREQARVQVIGRTQANLYHEMLPIRPELGLCRLPEPSEGDLYFDIEADRYVGMEGMEYLLGVAYRDGDAWQYQRWWALNAEEEKAAFEAFVAFVEERRTRYPTLHIYHFDHYEPSAVKRLMGRYATCEDEIDDWLRRRLFVDLHQVVRESLLAGVERYGLKEMEAFYAFERVVPLREAGAARAELERAIELGRLETLEEDVRPTVEDYNRDDCVSTAELHRWLESLRAARLASGDAIPRPVYDEPEISEALQARRERVQRLVDALTVNVPVDPDKRNAEQQARWLLAHSLDYYRREDKVAWWEKYRLMDLDPAEYEYEDHALGGLEWVETVGGTKQGIPIDRYRFPSQDCLMRGGAELHTPDGEGFGEMVGIDLNHCWIDVKKSKKTAAIHPDAVFEFSHVDQAVLEGAIERAAEWVLANGIDAPGAYRAARDLLLRLTPRLAKGTITASTESLVTDAQRVCRNLDHSILPIQGPPGSGKTYLGAELVIDLVRNGKKVGIVANSHKVIRNLLDAVLKASVRHGVPVRCAAKPGAKGDLAGTRIDEINDNGDALDAIRTRCDVLGGTKFLWARADAADSVDVLIVDEASQLALADAVAISGAAKSVVYLGDPMQLERPQKGAHPDGVDVSPLDHLLGNEKTMPMTQGIFMPQTRRLHPSICAYTSEVFYDGKLSPLPGLENQRLVDCGEFDGAGLHWVAVPHEGNQSASTEECDAITKILANLLKGRWVDERGASAPLTLNDILMVTPYNAQVAKLSERLPGARIGTVDKFQGQEAPVVIYSMATSSADEAPHGMEFLYSANRLNVATSRARCAVIVVASPKVFEVECRTPRQMRLANAIARLGELAGPRIKDQQA